MNVDEWCAGSVHADICAVIGIPPSELVARLDVVPILRMVGACNRSTEAAHSAYPSAFEAALGAWRIIKRPEEACVAADFPEAGVVEGCQHLQCTLSSVLTCRLSLLIALLAGLTLPATNPFVLGGSTRVPFGTASLRHGNEVCTTMP